MNAQLGDTVTCPAGPGTVVDRDGRGSALVKMDSGTVVDTEHGQWWALDALNVTGYDPHVMVWRGPGRERAGERTP